MFILKYIYNFINNIIKKMYIDMKIDTVNLGSIYGGFEIYDNDLKKKSVPIVYSFGVGEDISFDLVMMNGLIITP